MGEITLNKKNFMKQKKTKNNVIAKMIDALSNPIYNTSNPPLIKKNKMIEK